MFYCEVLSHPLPSYPNEHCVRFLLFETCVLLNQLPYFTCFHQSSITTRHIAVVRVCGHDYSCMEPGQRQVPRSVVSHWRRGRPHGRGVLSRADTSRDRCRCSGRRRSSGRRGVHRVGRCRGCSEAVEDHGRARAYRHPHLDGHGAAGLPGLVWR